MPRVKPRTFVSASPGTTVVVFPANAASPPLVAVSCWTVVAIAATLAAFDAPPAPAQRDESQRFVCSLNPDSQTGRQNLDVSKFVS